MTRAYGLAESTGPDGSNAQAVHELGQTGADVKIGLVAGRNVYTNHEAFFDKDTNGVPTGTTHAFNYDFSGDGTQPAVHDTWMAGIAVSRGGVLYPNDIGVAPGADVHCARVADNDDIIYYSWLENALDYLTDTQGCGVIMTGIAFNGIDPNGQSLLTLIYDYYAYEKDVVFAIPSGNGSNIWVFGDAYNGITTGGAITGEDDVYDRVGNNSSNGPTSDERQKPDVVAPSSMQTVPYEPNIWAVPPWNNGETSLSVPHTAGLAALLLGYADQTPNTNDGKKEVIKAVIVNSAFPNIDAKSGASTNPVDPNNVWHPDRGYGRVDALRAYELLDSNSVSAGSTTTQDKGWAYATMTSKTQVDHYFIQGQKNQRFVLTVTWNRRVDKNGYLNYSEENDPKFRVDLAVMDSNDVVLYSESDSLNNLKKVEMFLPYDDTYEIVLTNPNTKNNRSYAMAFELIAPLTADLNLDYVVDNSDLGVLAQNWLKSGSIGDLTGEGDVNLKDFAAFAANRGNFNPLYH